VMSEMGMAMMGTGVASGDDRAREAAEAAVSSPLLEDINLSGANGILVNVTAGEDLSIGEFTIIGDTVKEFASDEATVVVGTVIDPTMSNTIRVTVVATGLGKGIVGSVKPTGEIEPLTANPRSAPAEVDVPVTATGAPNYGDLDVPPGIRGRQNAVGHDVVDLQEDLDLLDIPAFLRRQAD